MTTPALVRIDRDWSQRVGWRKTSWQLSQMAKAMGPRLRIVSPSRSLIDDCSDRLQIEWIQDGIRVESCELDPGYDQGDCRNSFRRTHPVLETENDQPLVLFFGPLYRQTDVAKLVRAWFHFRQFYPRARFWVSGQGRGEDEVWQAIIQQLLVLSVVSKKQIRI